MIKDADAFLVPIGIVRQRATAAATIGGYVKQFVCVCVCVCACLCACRAKYPALDLAYAAGRAGGTMTGVLSAANEQSVAEFLEEKIHYLDIMRLNEECCEAHKKDWVGEPNLEQIVHYDQWARKWVSEKVRAVCLWQLCWTAC